MATGANTGYAIGDGQGKRALAPFTPSKQYNRYGRARKRLGIQSNQTGLDDVAAGSASDKMSLDTLGDHTSPDRRGHQ